MNQDGTKLPSHVDQLRTPGIDMTAGSLGQGLSCACGVALAGKLDGKDYRTFCIIGDGESDEGQIWEAAMFAAHRKLDNLVAITDCNRMQIDGTHGRDSRPGAVGRQVAGLQLGSFRDRRPRLGRHLRRPAEGDRRRGKPAMIIAHTVKGKGNAAVENKVDSHHVKCERPGGLRQVHRPAWATPVRCPMTIEV